VLRCNNAQVEAQDIYEEANTVNSRSLLLAAVLCFAAFAALAQDAAPVKQDPAVVRKYLARRAEYAVKIEKGWRDTFKESGQLPRINGRKDEFELPPLEAPAKEHLGKSNPETLIPQLKKQLKRLVKEAARRDLDRSEKREAKKQAAKIRTSLGYIKRRKVEFQKAYDLQQGARKELLEKQLAKLRTDPLTSYFMIGDRRNNAGPALAVGRFGLFLNDFSGDTNIHVQQVISGTLALVSYIDPRSVRVRFRSPLFQLKGVPTSKWANDTSIKLPGFFHVSGTTTYNTVSGGTNTVFVVEPFDPVAALKSVKQ